MMDVICHISLRLIQGDTLILILCSKLLLAYSLSEIEMCSSLTEDLTFSVLELQSLGVSAKCL